LPWLWAGFPGSTGYNGFYEVTVRPLTGIDQEGIGFLGRYQYAGDYPGGSSYFGVYGQEVPEITWM